MTIAESSRPIEERGAFARLIRRPRAAFGLAIIAVMVAAAVFAPWIMPHDPFEQSFDGLTNAIEQKMK